MEPYLGEIRLFGFNFAPRGWACCNGQLLPMTNNEALFTLIGISYGGDGVNTFGVPAFNNNIVPVGAGTRPLRPAYTLGQRGGAESVTLTALQLPSHTHQLRGGTQSSPPNPQQISSKPTGQALFGPSSPGQIYAPNATTPAIGFSPAAISSVGGNQSHENRQPYLSLNYCIAVDGIYPSRN